MTDTLGNLLVRNGLLTAFAVVGVTVWMAYYLSVRLTRGYLHGSALAIMIGLLLAYIGGILTGGKSGISDIEFFAGIGLMGGAMLRDFAIVSTAYGATLADMRRCGLSGIVSLFLGVLVSFVTGAIIAYSFGYTDTVSVVTIAAGAVTYIVGPVTGAAVGASSDVMALSIAAGLTKSVLTMIATPFVAKTIGLDNPRTAMIFGGMLGTTSGVCGGLAALDPKLVPYGAMTSTFYTGLGCLLGPSVLFLGTQALLGK